MSIIHCVRSKEHIQKILSEKKVSIDMVDHGACQSLDHFAKFSKPTIYYNTEDFLFTLAEETNAVFKDQEHIDLEQVEQFGWYYGKIHKSEIQIFSATSPQKYQSIIEQNPNLVISSYDKYRDFYRPVSATNLLNGAFGLSYACFKEKYDTLFRKIKVHKDQWIFDRSRLDNQDYPVLAHLFLYHNSDTQALSKTVFNSDELQGVRIFSFFLERSLDYFLKNDYSMDDFLNYMESEFGQNEDVKIFAQEFKSLNDKYVKRGLPFDTKNPITIVTKEFIDLAKTDTDKLHKILDRDDLNNTVVFLLGMLNLGDLIDEQLSFDYFVSAFVELTMKHIVDIKATDNEIIISFDQNEVVKNRNKKFDYVDDYFKELHNSKAIRDEINVLTDRSVRFNKIYKYRDDIIGLDSDVEGLKEQHKKLTEEKEDLTKIIENSGWFNDHYKNLIKSEDSKEELREAIKKLTVSIDSDTGRKEDLKTNLSDLKNDIDELNSKIKTLEQTKKAKETQLKKVDSKSDRQEKSSELEKNEQKPEKAPEPVKKTSLTRERPKQDSKKGNSPDKAQMSLLENKK